MRFLNDIYLKDSVEIRANTEKVFDFLVHLVDDESDHLLLTVSKADQPQEALVSG
ncbi:MAG: hypothetical protein ACYTFW_09915 [Planctomycetota bacterium]|jgi:hypothetical protein